MIIRRPYTPTFSSPYPDKWSKVTDFEYLSPDLHFIRPTRGEYIVSQEYRCAFKVDGVRHEITVPAGMLTDLTSVPWFGRWAVSKVGRHLGAAIVHDWFFIAWQDLLGVRFTPRERDFRFANAVMQAAMEAAGVKPWRRWLIGVAVGSFVGWWTYRGRNEGARYVRVIQ